MLEEIFELIFFFVPLSLLIFFRFFYRRKPNTGPPKKPGLLTRGFQGIQRSLNSIFDEPQYDTRENQPEVAAQKDSPAPVKPRPRTINQSVFPETSALYSTPDYSTSRKDTLEQPKKYQNQKNQSLVSGYLEKLNPLQQAIVLKEILGKPKSIDDEPFLS